MHDELNRVEKVPAYKEINCDEYELEDQADIWA